MVLFVLLLAIDWIQWTMQFGWIGLILLGILDHSLLPLPGSLDLLSIILASHNHKHWLIYAGGAWVGSVVGGYLTFRLGQKGGESMLEKRVPKRSLCRVSKWIEHHNMLAIFVPTLLPPPTPMSYFILAAGALKTPLRTFLLSFGAGRAIRYLLLTYFASQYGDQIIDWAQHNWIYILWGLVSLGAVAGIFFAWWWFNRRRLSPGA